jgi:hypothetical protein
MAPIGPAYAKGVLLPYGEDGEGTCLLLTGDGLRADDDKYNDGKISVALVVY